MPRRAPRLMSHERCHQGRGRNVKRQSQEDVGRALRHHARNAPIFFHIKLVHYVTRWQAHLVLMRRAPCGEHHAARRWICLDEINNHGHLVNALACVVVVTVGILGTKVSPLESVHRAGIVVPVGGIPVPNVDFFISEFLDVGRTFFWWSAVGTRQTSHSARRISREHVHCAFLLAHRYRG